MMSMSEKTYFSNREVKSFVSVSCLDEVHGPKEGNQETCLVVENQSVHHTIRSYLHRVL